MLILIIYMMVSLTSLTHFTLLTWLFFFIIVKLILSLFNSQWFFILNRPLYKRICWLNWLVWQEVGNTLRLEWNVLLLFCITFWLFHGFVWLIGTSKGVFSLFNIFDDAMNLMAIVFFFLDGISYFYIDTVKYFSEMFIL